MFTLIPAIGFNQECGFIYVTPGGSSSGTTGTRSNPANLYHAIQIANSGSYHVKISEGIYLLDTDLILKDSLILEGGFDSTNWIKSNQHVTYFFRDSTNLGSSPNRLTGILGQGVNDFNLLDIELELNSVAGMGTSIYGIYLDSCSNYNISRCKITVGAAGNGENGNSGVSGISGATGLTGESGQEEGNCCRLGGIGASGSFVGSNPGGVGGLGAERGGFDIDTIIGLVYAIGNYTNDGFAGFAGTGMGGSSPGDGGMGNCQTQYQQANCTVQGINHGDAGDDGINGFDGFNGTDGSATYSSGFYVPAQGSTGIQGLHGGGGAGGGGGGSKGCEPAVIDPFTGDTTFYTSGSGGGGGGGGEGGEGGFGGDGGYGGGSAFNIFLWNNGINGIIRDNTFIVGQGGAGGNGGSGGIGGTGGQGGEGGHTASNGCCNSCQTGEGGDGGNGGSGGLGGDGGNGSSGAALSIYQDPSGNAALVSNSYNPFEPDVFVNYEGCSNSGVVFSTSAIGQVNWVFGFGANPSTSNQTTDTVFYNSGATGFRTVSLIVDGVPYPLANYITIASDYQPPVIDLNKKIICTGASVTLNSNGSADTYSWNIPGGSVSSSTNQNVGSVQFSNAGIYIVSLTSTSCCGVHVTTDTVTVINQPTVDLGNDTSYCYLENIQALNAQNPGAQYSWYRDFILLSDTNNQYLPPVTGTYVCEVSYGTCSSSDTAFVDIFTTLPVDVGNDTLICFGNPFPQLSGFYSGATNYQWYFGNNPTGMNSPTLSINSAGNYFVEVTNAVGCFGSDSINVSVIDPVLDLGPDRTICSNESFPLINAGANWATVSWNLNGQFLSGNNPLQTSQPGSYFADVVDTNGCIANDSLVISTIVAPNAIFTGPASGTIGTVINFTDGSTPVPDGWTWNYGDGSTLDTIQNGVHTYTEPGFFPVLLIVNNGFCTDTFNTDIEMLYDCNQLGITASFTPSSTLIYLDEDPIVSFINSSTNSTGYSWNFGNGNSSSDVDPFNVYTAQGTYTVTLTSSNYNCSDQTTVTIQVFDSQVGISELNNSSLTFFPNPFSDQLKINSLDVEAYLNVYNELGQHLGVFEVPKDIQDLNEKLLRYKKGVYFLQIFNRTDSEIYFYKLIKQ